MRKNCIIFDNEDQSEEIEKLVREAKRKHGIKLYCEQFNVGSTSNIEFLTSGKIDINKVINEFKNRYRKGVEFHIAAFDWDLGDDVIDGVELIRHLNSHDILKNTPKLLYSGLLEDKISGQLDLFKKGNLKKDALLRRIKALIKIDIKDFVERENYDNDILTILKNSEDSLDLIIERELATLPNLIFKNSFVSPSFNGKTFNEISTIIGTDNRLKNKFKKEIIEQVISYLTVSYSE